MPDIVQSIKNRNAALKEVSSWSDGFAGQKPVTPTNVTGNPPAKSPANMAADNAQQAANTALKGMGY